MRWLKLTVAYDGTDFVGWQVQPAQPTVQAAVERAWQAITGEQVSVTSSGRTDSGVHALGQVVGVETNTEIANSQLVLALNAKLSDDVTVLKVDNAPQGFHATYDAVAKHYRYTIHNSHVRSVFARRTSWHFPRALDAEAMHRAAQSLIGKHDFVSFETSGSQRATSVRTILQLTVCRGADGLPNQITIDVEGDGFLYNMVRTIVGTLVEVGQGSKPESWVAEVVAQKDRKSAGQTAPAQGLFLMSVRYE